MSKSVHVEYFAQSRLATGVARETVELTNDADLDNLIEILIARHGEPMRKLLGGPGPDRSQGLLLAIGQRQIAPGEAGPLRD